MSVIYADIAIFRCPCCDQKIEVNRIQTFGERLFERKPFHCPHCEREVIWAKVPFRLFNGGMAIFLLGIVPLFMRGMAVWAMPFYGLGATMTVLGILNQRLVAGRMERYSMPPIVDPLCAPIMTDESKRPTLGQFRAACRDEFAFLAPLGFREVEQPGSLNEFRVQFSNGDFVVTIQGENYGLHAGATLHDSSGRMAPPFGFVPHAERNRALAESTEYSQLDDIRRSAEVIQTYCVPVFEGDREAFDRVAHEWRRVTDPEFRRSLQERKLP
jgi:hypothetical protein